MRISSLLFFCSVLISSCSQSENKNYCKENEKASKFGLAFNKTRLKYGAPVIHDYLCLESTSEKMESWSLSKEIQDTISIGFHDGKGVFLQTDGLLEEKDIFRKRINDSTFVMLGILTYVSKDMKVDFPDIWYDTISAGSIGLSKKTREGSERTNTPKYGLTITQADSVLRSWGTSRTE